MDTNLYKFKLLSTAGMFYSFVMAEFMTYFGPRVSALELNIHENAFRIIEQGPLTV